MASRAARHLPPARRVHAAAISTAASRTTLAWGTFAQRVQEQVGALVQRSAAPRLQRRVEFRGCLFSLTSAEALEGRRRSRTTAR